MSNAVYSKILFSIQVLGSSLLSFSLAIELYTVSVIQCVRYDNKDNEQRGSISKVVDDNTGWILNE